MRGGRQKDRTGVLGPVPPGSAPTGTWDQRRRFSRKLKVNSEAQTSKGRDRLNRDWKRPLCTAVKTERKMERSCRQDYGEALSDLRAGGGLPRNLPGWGAGLKIVEGKIVQLRLLTQKLGDI